MSKYGSRKFLAALATLASTHWALIERLIASDTYAKIVIAVMVAYLTANVAQKKLGPQE